MCVMCKSKTIKKGIYISTRYNPCTLYFSRAHNKNDKAKYIVYVLTLTGEAVEKSQIRIFVKNGFTRVRDVFCPQWM
jgi:hypothetical protein